MMLFRASGRSAALIGFPASGVMCHPTNRTNLDSFPLFNLLFTNRTDFSYIIFHDILLQRTAFGIILPYDKRTGYKDSNASKAAYREFLRFLVPF